MEVAFQAIEGKAVDKFTFHFARPHEKKDNVRPRFSPETAHHKDQLEKDLSRIMQVAQILEQELGDAQDCSARVIQRAEQAWQKKVQSTEGGAEDVPKDASLDETKLKLDMMSVYLRQAHMYCYYCGLESESSEELHRKCALHYRKRPGSEPIPKEKNWHKYHDGKLEVKILGDSFEVWKVGGVCKDMELDRRMENGKITYVEEQKFRCVQCQKLFKGEDFVKKHIRTKHPESLADWETEISFFNNYMRDPNRLTPSTTPNPTAMGMSSMPMIPPNPGLFVPPLPLLPPVFPFPIAAAVAGTPLDQIPRLGFDMPENPFRGTRRPSQILRRLNGEPKGETTAHSPPPPPPEGAAVDPRSVRSYEDLDAPAGGGDMDAEISFF